jgi:hypothetical protein
MEQTTATDAEASPCAREDREGSPVPASSGNRIHRDGDYWTIRYDGVECRLRDTKGLHFLARLLARPGEEIHALELVSEGGAEPPSQLPSAPSAAAALDRLGMHSAGLGDSGEVLDAQAKAAYKRRLRELDQEVEEARSIGDTARAARAEQEIELLAQQLAGAVGLGGRDRRAGSAAERSRMSVSRTIKTVIEKLREGHPVLGEHLEQTVKTGTYCSYCPDPRVPTSWKQ